MREVRAIASPLRQGAAARPGCYLRVAIYGRGRCQRVAEGCDAVYGAFSSVRGCAGTVHLEFLLLLSAFGNVDFE